MRRKQTQAIGEVIREFLKNSEMSVKIQETRVIRHWYELMGSNIAAATQNIYIKDGTLHIQIYSSIVRNELYMLRDKIKEALNEKAGFEVIKNVVVR